MPGAGTGRERLVGNIFGKLNQDDSVKETLQYPQELGEDEYNQFILFTIYEKASDEVKARSKELSDARQSYEDQIEKTISDGLNAAKQSDVYKTLRDSIGTQAADTVTKAAIQAQVVGGQSLSDVWGWLKSKFGGQPDFDFSENQFIELSKNATTIQGLSDNISKAKNNLDIAQETQNELIDKARNKIDLSSRSSIEYFNKQYGGSLTPRSQSTIQATTRLAKASFVQSESIALYIPNKIINNSGISYNNVDFSTIRQGESILLGDFGSIGPGVKRYVSNILDSVTGFLGVPTNAAEAITAVTGLAINPRQEQIFQGVSTRSFDFSFSLAPRNSKEAQTISKIVRTLRKYGHPSVAAGKFFLSVPAEFDIRYYKIMRDGTAVENLFLNRIDRCALTSINVDYTPNGINATFEDGSPVRTSLTMTFTELRPLVREDIEAGF